MPCYHPLQGWRSSSVNASGKRSIVFTGGKALRDMPITLPCGRCIGCRLEYSREWAIRIMHEASLYERNCFITLTFDDEHLPADKSLDVSVFQDFMKRLRKRYGEGIRFFHCGEYGEQNARPHYHAIIFNHDFSDRVFFSSRNDCRLDTSEELQTLWPNGFVTVGNVTFESASYVARYVCAKITNKESYTDKDGKFWPSKEDYYAGRKPEYCTMSRRPGIGTGWAKQFLENAYFRGSIIMRGKELRPPKFYDSIFKAAHSDEYAKLKAQRKARAKQNADDNTGRRLDEKEFIKLQQCTLLKRG